MKHMPFVTRLPLLICLILLAPVICSAQRPELVVQTGHSGTIHSVAFSPDGKQLASGSLDKTIRLWDAASGAQLRTLEGHGDDVTSVAFSPDGKALVSASKDRTIKLWDAATGAPLGALSGHRGGVRSVAFSPDGTTLASGSEDNTIRLWNAATGAPLRVITGHTRVVKPGASGSARLTDAATGALLVPPRAYDPIIKSVAFSPDGATLVSIGSEEYVIRLWDVATGAPLRTLSGHGHSVSSVAFSPDGRTLVSSSWDKTIRLWDAATGAPLRTLAGDHEFFSAVFSPDGRTLASGSGDNKIRLWDAATGAPLRSFDAAGALGVVFSPDGKTLVAGSILWDVATGTRLRTLDGHSDWVLSLAFSPDGTTLAVSGIDRKVRLWDMTTGTQLRSLESEGVAVRLAFSPDGKTLAAGNDGKNVQLWDVATGATLRTLSYYGLGKPSLAFSPDGQRLAVGATLWDVASDAPPLYLDNFSRGAISAAFSPDGRTLACGNEQDKTIKLLDAATGALLRSIDSGGETPRLVGFSPDGRLLVGADWRTIKLWDAATGAQFHSFSAHGAVVNAVAFSPDGRTLVSGEGHTLSLRDVASGAQLYSHTGHSDDIIAVAFSPDGRTLASGSRDAKTKLWDAKSGRELASLIALDATDWAVVTRDGRYDASPKAMELMHWVVGNEVISLNQLKERYYEPNLLPKLLGYSKEPLRDINAFKEVKLSPAVAYEPPPTGSTKLTLRLTDTGGGVGRVQVFVNGKEVAADARGLRVAPKAAPQTLVVDLAAAPYIAGQPNEIRVVTWNAEGYIASRGEVRTWTPTGAAPTNDPQLYAVVVGVSNYSSPDIKLRFPDKDAADIAKAIEVGARRLFGAGGVHLTLFNTSGDARAIAPRKAGIKKAFEEVARKARPWDIFVVYFAGHGTGQTGSDSYFYLTQEARSFSDLEDPAVRAEVSISSDELTDWIKQIPALKQIMVLDTCAAGQAAVRLIEKRSVSGDQIRAIERMKDRTGFHVLMGSASDAVSYEASQYGQGLLTFALLQGMRGAALRDGEFVDISPLFQYAADQVPRLAQDIGGIQRPLVAAPRGTSFDIGRLDKSDKEAIPLALVKPLILRPLLINPDEGTDNLGLMTALRKSLNEESFVEMRGMGSSKPQTLVFVDADELPGAVRPSGTYTVEGEKVTIRLFLTRDGQKIGPLLVEGPANDQSALVARLTKAIKEAIRQLKN